MRRKRYKEDKTEKKVKRASIENHALSQRFEEDHALSQRLKEEPCSEPEAHGMGDGSGLTDVSSGL